MPPKENIGIERKVLDTEKYNQKLLINTKWQGTALDNLNIQIDGGLFV